MATRLEQTPILEQKPLGWMKWRRHPPMTRLELWCAGVGAILAIYFLGWDHPSEPLVARAVWISAEAAAGGAAGLIVASLLDRFRRFR